MIFRSKEMNRFEHTSTKVVARPIETPFIAAVVTPSVGHMPSIRVKVGFSVIRPL